VQRIAFEVAVRGVGVGHETGAVKGGDGLGVSESGRDHFAPTRVTGHEMRLYEACHNLEIRLDKTLVESHHRAPGFGGADQNMVFIVSRVVILDSHCAQDP
jgi:hypothetical protein